MVVIFSGQFSAVRERWLSLPQVPLSLELHSDDRQSPAGIVTWLSSSQVHSVQYVSDGCHHLKYIPLSLKLHSDDQQSPAGIVTWLSSSQVSSVQYVSDGCHCLEYLCLSNCTKMTDRALQHCHMVVIFSGQFSAVCERWLLLPQVPLSLDLHSDDRQSPAGIVTWLSYSQVSSVQYVSDSCHRLKYLCLSNCTQMTDRALQALSHGCHLLRSVQCST